MIDGRRGVKKMKIEVWSDYACPFCYIGKRRLEEALKVTGFEGKVEVVFKAFQLDPSAPKVSEESTYERLAKKYGKTVDEAKEMTENVTVQAKTVGLDYNFDKITTTNTFDAHRLVKLAEQEGVASEVTERLLKAYFIDGEKIGLAEVLLRLAKEEGIPSDRAKEVLNSEEFAEDVKADINEGGQLGVQGVPFFVIDRKYAISGAQSVETFANALQKAAVEEQ